MKYKDENAILFTAYECYLKLMIRHLELAENSPHVLAAEAIEQSTRLDGKGYTAEYTWDGDYNTSKPLKEPWSHDNHTALVALNKIAPGTIISHFPSDWTHRIHPRDLVWYAWTQEPRTYFQRLTRAASFFFLWIPSIAMIWSCATSSKNTDGSPNLSGELLTWLRLETKKMRLTSIICDVMIVLRFGSWAKVFEGYFKDAKHPIVELANKVYK